MDQEYLEEEIEFFDDKDKEEKYKEKDKLKDKAKYKEDKGDKKDKQDKKDKGNKEKVIKEPSKKKKRKAKKAPNWQLYIHKVLKTVHEEECTLSSKAMAILDSFANDLFERISSEAVKLLRINNKKTLTYNEIQTAARLVLPGELCRHAMVDGDKAVDRYKLQSRTGPGGM